MRHAEEVLRTRYCDGFNFINDLIAAVVSAADISFGIFVGQDRSVGLENGGGGVVFRRYHLETLRLTLGLSSDLLIDLLICSLKRTIHRCASCQLSVSRCKQCRQY